MTTFNTGNPVPSTDGRDLSDNAESIDEFVSGASLTTITRTGKDVRTLAGINNDGNAAIAAISNVSIGLYLSDPTFNNRNEFVNFDRAGTNETYRLRSTTPTPYLVNSGATPDPLNDANLQPFTDISTIGELSNFVFDNVSDMIAGSIGPYLITHVVGAQYSSGATSWRVINVPVVTILDLEPLSNIHVEDFDYGSDINSVLSDYNSLNSRKYLVFDAKITYLVSGQFEFTNRTYLWTNGCLFKTDSSAGASSAALFFNCPLVYFDEINFDSTDTFNTRFRPVNFSGCLAIRGQKVSFVSSLVVANPTSLDFTLRFSLCQNVFIKNFDFDNHDRCMKVDIKSGWFGYVKIRSYVTGAFIERGLNFDINRSDIQTKSPNASVTPGHNAYLIGNEFGDYQTANVNIKYAYIRDSGEHGIRVSGDFNTRAINLIKPDIGKTGGSNIKYLNSDNGIYCEDSIIDSPTLYDAEELGIKLSCGIIAYRVKNMRIISPVIKALDAAESATHGISIYDVIGMTISDPQIYNVKEQGISVRASHPNAIMVEVIKDTNALTVDGGVIESSGDNGIQVNVDVLNTHRNMSIKTKIRNSVNDALDFNAPGGGEIDLGYFGLDVERNGDVLDLNSLGNTSQLLFEIKGQDATISKPTGVSDGSTWMVQADGLYVHDTLAWRKL
jgi:hypothetical protein